MARHFSLYRICSYFLIVFCALHTFGLLSRASYGPGVDTVRSLMDTAGFTIMGSSVTWGGMYLGFGLLFSVFLLFSAFLAWYMGGLTGKGAAPFLPVGWALLVTFALVAGVSWAYFFIAPGAMATLIALLMAVGNVRTYIRVR